MKTVVADFVIIGSGLAGSVAAYALSKFGDVLLLSKEPSTKSNSFAAQGGIAAAVGLDDAPELHQLDTLLAGGDLCDPKVVSQVTARAPEIVRWLAELGVPFNCTPSGVWKLGLEGAHSRKRILHAGGDATGRRIMETMRKAVEAIPNVVRIPRVRILSLLENSNAEVMGARGWVLNDGKEPHRFFARRATILATGGAGQLFLRTTNPTGATGDGIALGYRAGARLRNLEFVQFHPTALDVDGARGFLISEAVRGAGGVLVDENQRRIMADYPRLDLEPRDVVSRVIYTEMEKGKTIYLDGRSIQDFSLKFPTIDQVCRTLGFDPALDLLPVSPAAHFMMGGIHTDLSGQTSVPGLYATGEVACTGLHGANRLASNSLLECAVMGHALAESLHRAGDERSLFHDEACAAVRDGEEADLAEDVLIDVQEILWKTAGMVREQKTMEQGLHALRALAEEHGMSFAVETATLILQSALSRKESRGAHYRSDYPRVDGMLNGVDTEISQNRIDRVRSF
ncbi:L-aspartate oxidase [Ferroacidibacillus organovorans]|uniref:L-aspartate oxidase n=1 Tax=Ferroacidibacillus organovorans TaxID=1765683 RepID=A0A1V4EVX1_9BACL|nr:L-aspartate oxidase [Ferroacidibacillus organovorans]OPG16990.1 L-aspartate oxidase [Ferroacidibacillus organovorans]